MQNLSHLSRASVPGHVTILLFSPRQPLSYLKVARVYLVDLLLSQTHQLTHWSVSTLNASCASNTQQPCKVLEQPAVGNSVGEVSTHVELTLLVQEEET